jgi:hypothetical protein
LHARGAPAKRAGVQLLGAPVAGLSIRLFNRLTRVVAWVQKQADRVRTSGIQQYAALKARIFKLTALLVAVGMVVSAAAGGVEAGAAFTTGGAVAFAYQLMLNRSVDALPLGGPAESQPHDAAEGPARALLGGNGATRVALVSGLMLAAVYGAQSWDRALLPFWYLQRDAAKNILCCTSPGTGSSDARADFAHRSEGDAATQLASPHLTNCAVQDQAAAMRRCISCR